MAEVFIREVTIQAAAFRVEGFPAEAFIPEEVQAAAAFQAVAIPVEVSPAVAIITMEITAIQISPSI